MAGSTEIDPDMTIDEVMRLWPQTIGVLIAYNMLCIGCALAPFHTVIDAAVEHGMDENRFLADLNRAIAKQLT